MKKTIAFLLTLMTLFSFSVPAYASEVEVEEEESIQWEMEETETYKPLTRWTNISIITLSVVPNGTTVTAGFDVQGYFQENTVKVTGSLQKFYNGSWQTVSSYTKSRPFYCATTFTGTVPKGLLVRLQLNVEVYNQYGSRIESFTTTSSIKTV